MILKTLRLAFLEVCRPDSALGYLGLKPVFRYGIR